MAKLRIDIHPEAILEEDSAYLYYLARGLRAAELFRSELERAREAIQSAPETCASYLHGTRRYKLRRYPYIVVYRVAESRIEVIAVAHGRRKPGYWAKRLRR